MGVINRLETLYAANRQEQARDLATGVIQNETIVDTELVGTAPDADGQTVILVETEHFYGRHVLADRAARGTGWPGSYTLKGDDTTEEFNFRTATMPNDAEHLVEDQYDIRQAHTQLPEGDDTGATSDIGAGD